MEAVATTTVRSLITDYDNLFYSADAPYLDGARIGNLDY